MLRILLAPLAAIVLASALTAQAGAETDRLTRVLPYERAGVHHVVLRGRVLDHEDQPAAGARVLLYSYQPFYSALPLSETTTSDDGAFVFDDVSGTGELLLWAISRQGTPFCRGSRSLNLVSGRETAITVRLEAPTDDNDAKTVTVHGVVRDDDGAPVPGGYLRFQGDRATFDPGAFATVAPDGTFAITCRTGYPASASLFLGGGKIALKHSAGKDTLARQGLDWPFDLARSEWTLQQKAFGSRAVTVQGAGDQEVELSVAFGGQWRACDPRIPTLTFDRGSSPSLVRARIAGHVARVISVPASTSFDFATSVPMTLEVTSLGHAVAFARVDLCRLDADDAEGPWADTATTDAQGRVVLQAPPDTAYAVYAYAAGHAAARGIWRAGTLRLQLEPLAAELHVPAADTRSLFVRPAGSFASAAVVYPEPGAAIDVALAPGRYEVTRYGNAEDAVFVEAVELAAGTTVETQVAEDRRPTVLLTLPRVEDAKDKEKDKWWAQGSRSAIGGMVSKWMAHSGGGQSPHTRELVAVVTPVAGNEQQLRLRFPISGRFTVCCGRRALPHRYFTDIDAALGQELELTLPALDASASGEAKDYPDGWKTGGQHGIAGPRLMLRPQAGDVGTFGVLVALPEPAKFTLTSIPAGKYLLEHHLYETGFFIAKDGTFGGTPVEVAARATTDLGILDHAGSAITVEIVGRTGKPLSGTLAIRDRMFESWDKVVEEGTTLRDAEDPIPTPPSVRLDASGRASLKTIRKGRLELVLTTDDGRRVWFERSVTADADAVQRLQIDLDEAR